METEGAKKDDGRNSPFPIECRAIKRIHYDVLYQNLFAREIQGGGMYMEALYNGVLAVGPGI